MRAVLESKLSSSLYTISLISLLYFANTLAVVTPSDELLPVDKVCNATNYPSFCRSVLTNTGKRRIYDYSRSCVSQSLDSAVKFSSLIDKYLAERSSLPNSAIQALEDCQLLMGLNIDFLQTCNTTLGSTQTLPENKIADLQSMLSAMLTNQQTCLEGIQTISSSWTVPDELSTPLSNGTKLYSVSLGLFGRGWVKRKVSLERRRVAGRWENWRSLLPERYRKGTNSVSGRKLLQQSDTVIVRDIVVVNPDRSGNFTTINDAIAAAPNKTEIADGYFIIYVVAGVYEEYINIDKNRRNLLIIGDGINQTIITGNRSVGDGWTTSNSATLAVLGQGFVAIGITVRNTAGPIKHQAVAVRNQADMSTFYNCSFEGYQDTLYPHSMRQFYRECDIYGTVDFIFGNAAVVLQNCNIYPTLPMSGQFNAITAQGRTDPGQNTGTSIQNCTIKATPALAANTGTKTYLGRPWKEYSNTVFMQSFMDSLIDPAGWHEWSGDFALNTLYYAEYANTGPGSNTTKRVSWPGYHVLDDTDAISFTVSNFILGDYWLYWTGVPYDADACGVGLTALRTAPVEPLS